MKMPSTVGALAGVILALGGSAPAGAVEDERVVPTITVGDLSRLVPYDTTAVVTFIIKTDNRPLARKPVRVCSAPAVGDWTCVNTATSASGRVDARRRVTAAGRVNVVVPESTTYQTVTSDTVTLTPQVAVKLTRKPRTTIVVALTYAAGQHLVVRRQEGTRWLIDRIQPVTAKTMTLTGLDAGKRYHVVVADTPTIKGNVSATV
jgi:hypothetical protein